MAAYQICRQDNVATALEDIAPGKVQIRGESPLKEIVAIENIPAGHKIAVQRIEAGQLVIKYAVPIGIAVKTIEPGSWVHLHNIRSRYDERSQHLDVITGAPKDIEYK